MDNEYKSYAELLEFFNQASEFLRQYEDSINTKIVCNFCHGDLIKSGEKYLCTSGHGHVEGMEQPVTKFLKKCEKCGSECSLFCKKCNRMLPRN